MSFPAARRLVGALLLAFAAHAGAQGTPPAPNPPNGPPATPAAARRDTLALHGTVYGMDGRVPPQAIAISLTAFDATGALQWRQVAVTDSATGRYAINFGADAARWPARFQLDIDRQRLRHEPIDMWAFRVWRHKWSEAVRLTWPGDAIKSAAATKYDLKLRYDTAPPSYTFYLFLPALVGLFAAMIAASLQTWRRQPGGADGRRDRVLSMYGYSGAVAWVVVIGLFTIGYVRSDLQTINLFSPTLAVPVLVPIAAFLGVLVYATECLIKIHSRNAGASDVEDAEADGRVFLELGNRIFIAPYVALITVLVMFEDRTSASASFVAFFTGLWIQPVMQLLQGLGERLISATKLEPAPPPAEAKPTPPAGAKPAGAKPDEPGPVVEPPSPTPLPPAPPLPPLPPLPAIVAGGAAPSPEDAIPTELYDFVAPDATVRTGATGDRVVLHELSTDVSADEDGTELADAAADPSRTINEEARA